MKVTLLGTGSDFGQAGRAGSGYLVEAANARILLDCGGGVARRLTEVGLRPNAIDYIFLTHLHADHMSDLAAILHTAWVCGGPVPRVFGPAPTADIVEGCFASSGPYGPDIASRIGWPGSVETMAPSDDPALQWPEVKVTEICPGFALVGDGWSLTCCEVPHASPHLVTLACRVDSRTASMVWSSDAGPSTELETLAAGTDLLLHWCYRLPWETDDAYLTAMAPSAQEIGELAERAGAARLVLTHLRAEADEPGHHSALLMRAKAAFSGDVAIGADLMTIELP